MRKTLTMTQKFARMMSFPRIFKSRKVGNGICFIMTFFRIPVRKTSEEDSHWNEENTVKMIQRKVIVILKKGRPSPDHKVGYHFETLDEGIHVAATKPTG